MSKYSGLKPPQHYMRYRNALEKIRDMTSSAYSTPSHSEALDLLRTINSISANAIRLNDDLLQIVNSINANEDAKKTKT